jgi:signal transduction histidine kinase
MLPLEDLLQSLDQWALERDSTTLERLRSAVSRVVSTLGADGARIEFDAPPVPMLTMGVGTLAAEPPPGSRPDDGVESFEIAVPGEDLDVHRVLVAGEPDRRLAAGRALGLALSLAWSRMEARAAAARVAALDDATRAIAGEIDLDKVLQLIVERVRPLVDARYAALGIVGPYGRLASFITSGITAEERRRIGDLPRGLGLLGTIIREARSIRVADIATDPRRHGFPAHHPEMHSFLGVPVMVQGVSVGNLYLTEKQGASAFTAADQRLVETFAVHAGIAIERARLHVQVQRLAIVDERERISRELHDGVIQSLYAVSLSLEDVPELIDGDRSDAVARVDRAINDLHATIRDVRNFIVGLRPEALGTGELRQALETMAEDARRRGIDDVQLAVDEQTNVTELLATEIMQAAREAISNAVRHAEASRLVIRLVREGGDVVLEVEDDGRGFDPAAEVDATHHGLRNLEARARGMHGSAVISSTPGQGTRVTIRVTDGVI